MRKQLYLSVILLGASLAVRAEEAPPDRVNVPLTDPSRPAVVNASLMNGGITVTGYADTIPVTGEPPSSEANQRITISLTLVAREHPSEGPKRELEPRPMERVGSSIPLPVAFTPPSS